jgi:malate synthase
MAISTTIINQNPSREIFPLGDTNFPSALHSKEILSTAAVCFLSELHRAFNHERVQLLNRRLEVQDWLRCGGKLDFPSDTRRVRESEWKVAPCPPDLQTRHVEITGPCEAKMMVNALNSGADAFMADIEDSLSPTWANVLAAQQNLFDASRGRLAVEIDGKRYAQKPGGATLLVRPRGWHLSEKNFLVDEKPISASLFDFGLHFFHNAEALLERGSGPYFYLPKMESSLEARLWNKVFLFAQDTLGLQRGTIRATVLIETITAAFEMDEILFELREHASGLNAGRWDYLFSVLKKFSHTSAPFPDRSLLTMDLPFLRAYSELLVQSCHRRGAHAIGGMSAFIPSRRDPAVNANALAKVSADKEREIGIGFDGSWVAHPDLVQPVKKLFVDRLEGRPDQKSTVPPKAVLPADLLPRDLKPIVTEAGIRTNISVALTYTDRWLEGQGAVAIHNLMEDAATAEISRAQLWQWVRLRAETTEGAYVTEELFGRMLEEELAKLGLSPDREAQLRELLRYLVLHHEFVDFLTKPAYETLLSLSPKKLN